MSLDMGEFRDLIRSIGKALKAQQGLPGGPPVFYEPWDGWDCPVHPPIKVTILYVLAPKGQFYSQFDHVICVKRRCYGSWQIHDRLLYTDEREFCEWAKFTWRDISRLQNAAFVNMRETPPTCRRLKRYRVIEEELPTNFEDWFSE